jgi:hypothetical protein
VLSGIFPTTLCLLLGKKHPLSYVSLLLCVTNTPPVIPPYVVFSSFLISHLPFSLSSLLCFFLITFSSLIALLLLFLPKSFLFYFFSFLLLYSFCYLLHFLFYYEYPRDDCRACNCNVPSHSYLLIFYFSYTSSLFLFDFSFLFTSFYSYLFLPFLISYLI